MRVFTILGQFTCTVEADYVTHGGTNVYFWQRSPRWWQRNRRVGVVDWRFVACIDSHEKKTDHEIACEMGVVL